MGKIKVPRKKKKQIPKGPYCYKMTSGFKILDNGKYGYNIEKCLFYSKGKCKLLKCEIMDQCKECGINWKF